MVIIVKLKIKCFFFNQIKLLKRSERPENFKMVSELLGWPYVLVKMIQVHSPSQSFDVLGVFIRGSAFVSSLFC